MRRREFIATLGSAAVWPLAARAREALTMLDITLSVNLARFLLRGLQ